MTTAEKITAGIALLAALGVGAVLQAWVSHLLHRRERKINIADKSVQMAETLMTRMETELTRAQEALAKAQQESEELRIKLAEAMTVKGKLSGQLQEMKDSLRGMNTQISQASTAVSSIQGEVHSVQIKIARQKPHRALLYATLADKKMAERLRKASQSGGGLPLMEQMRRASQARDGATTGSVQKAEDSDSIQER
ncbi:hypothetical protein ACIA8B_14835 [Micromonospora chalcea]